jgi:hypothetical protein
LTHVEPEISFKWRTTNDLLAKSNYSTSIETGEIEPIPRMIDPPRATPYSAGFSNFSRNRSDSPIARYLSRFSSPSAHGHLGNEALAFLEDLRDIIFGGDDNSG